MIMRKDFYQQPEKSKNLLAGNAMINRKGLRPFLSLLFMSAGILWGSKANAQITFNYTTSVQTYTVAAGVSSLAVDMAGAKGGDFPGYGVGGGGGRVQCTINVTPGQVFYVYVGSTGTNGACCGGAIPAGGSNSGGGADGGSGSNGDGGAAGGASSDIRTSTPAMAGSIPGSLSTRIIVAGGGGSFNCGTENGGAGGDIVGGAGYSCNTTPWSPTNGGSQTAGGPNEGGSTAAGLGYGGSAAPINYGGGGGGGLYGGGGCANGSGGGGSSYPATSGGSITSIIHTQGYQNGNGYVTLTPLNTAPTFNNGTTQGFSICENASTLDITSLLHVNDADVSQTETWTVSSAPNNGGTLTGFSTANTASSGSTDITPGNTVTYTPAAGYSGTETFAIQVSDGSATATTTFTVTVNPTPTVNSVSDQTVCNGAATTAVTFSGAVAGTTFSWTNGNTSIGLAASGSGNIASFTATNGGSTANSGLITVTPSANSCNGSTTSFNINVNPTPTVSGASDQSVCNAASTTAITFGGTVAGTTYNWTNTTTSIGLAASGSGNIASFTATNGGVTVITTTITVTPSANSCNGSSTNFTIDVNPTPDVTAITSQAVCNGDGTAAVTFSGFVSGTTYTWTNSDATIGLANSGTGDIASFTATNSTSSINMATITVTPTANTCDGPRVSFTISVNPTPTAGGAPDQSVCNTFSTAAINFTGAVAGTTYGWTNTTTSIGLAASGSGNIASFTATNSTSVTDTGNIIVTPSANGCVGIPDTFMMIVYPTPNVVPTADQAKCNGAGTDAVSFSGAVGGTTYTWTNSNSTIGVATTGGGDIASFTATNITSVTDTGTIIVTPSANGCAGPVDTFMITVYPTPNVMATPDQAKCNGLPTDSVTFSGAVSGTTYAWTNNNSGTGLAGSGSGDIASFTASNGSSVNDTATIIVTPSANGCAGMPDTFMVVVYPTPADITGTTDSVCAGSSTLLTDADAGGTWSASNPHVLVSGTGLILGVTAGTSIITYMLPTSCITTMVFTVDTLYVPAISISSGGYDTSCVGTFVLFTANVASAGASPILVWERNGWPVSISPTYGLVPNNGDNIYCKLATTQQCQTTDSTASNHIRLQVDSSYIPFVAIAATPGTSVHAGEAVAFTATVTGGGPQVTYQWVRNSTPITGATTDTYTSSSLADNDSISCGVQSVGPCGYFSFNSVKMHVFPTGTTIPTLTNAVTIFPNPTTGMINIKAEVAGVFYLYTLEGRSLGEYEIAEGITNINLPNELAAGVYMGRYAGTDGNTVLFKIVKN